MCVCGGGTIYKHTFYIFHIISKFDLFILIFKSCCLKTTTKVITLLISSPELMLYTTIIVPSYHVYIHIYIYIYIYICQFAKETGNLNKHVKYVLSLKYLQCQLMQVLLLNHTRVDTALLPASYVANKSYILSETVSGRYRALMYLFLIPVWFLRVHFTKTKCKHILYVLEK
jgi:hypothetical protein